MPTVQGIDNFNHGNFTVPGGASYDEILGTPAKDTTVTQGTDPASLLISISASREWVRHAITGSPTKPWTGFWFRLALADEPSADVPVAQLNAVDGFHGRLTYQPSADRFYTQILGGAVFPTSAAYTFSSWVWIEMILDTGTATRTLYCRIGGVDLSPATFAHAASTGNGIGLGTPVTPTTIPAFRYSNNYWGTAASVTDWMGPPVSATAPSAPQTLQAVAGDAQIGLSWLAPASNGGSIVTGYKIYRSLTTNTETLLASPAGTGLTYTDSTTANGTTYFYKVSAVNAIGESTLSSEVSATPVAPVVPPPIATRVLKRLYGPAQLGNSNATLYMCPASTTAVIRHIHVSNPTGSAVPFTLSIGTSTSANRLWDDFLIAADDVLDHYQDHVLEAGEIIQAMADTAATLNLTIDGYEVGTAASVTPIYPSDSLLPSNTSP